MILGRLERDTILYAAGKAVAGGAGIITLLALTRTLGVESYGRLSLWIVIATWISQAGSGWLRQSILRFHAAYRRADGCEASECGRYHATVRTLSLTSIVLCVFATLVAAQLAAEPTWAATAVAGVLAGGLAWWNTRLSYLQAELRSRAAVLTDLVRTVTPLPLIAAAYFAGILSVETALLMTALSTVLAASIGRTPATSESRHRLCPAIARRLVAFGLPMSVWFLLSSSHVLVGRLVLEQYGSAHALGLYSAVQDVVTRGFGLMFMPMTLALHTHVMSLWAKGRTADADRAIAKAYLYLAAAGALCAMAILILGPWLPRLLFDHPDPPPRDTIILTGLIAAAACATQAGLVAHKGLELRERTRLMVGFMAISLVVNAAISFGTLPLLGVNAPALGSLAGNSCYFLIAHVASRRVLRAQAGGVS